jgi:hypothetical protein
MAPASHGHQIHNNKVSGDARAHFGDVHNEKTFVWNTGENCSHAKCTTLIAAVHIHVQMSGSKGRHGNICGRSPASDSKISENVESLPRDADPDFEEITMYSSTDPKSKIDANIT